MAKDMKIDIICTFPVYINDEIQGLFQMHIAKLNGRICGAKRSHSVFEQPNCYQSV